MSTEPAPSASAAAASNTNGSSSSNDKGKGRAVDGDGDADGDTNDKSDGPAAAEATGENKENETPEAMRAQLEAVRRELQASIEKKQGIDRQLASHEAAIYAFETSYLAVDLSANAGNATFGNIVRGYDSYLKPATGSIHDTSSSSASRKKGASSSSSTRGVGYTTGIIGPGGGLFQPVQEEDRLFSRSSSTYLESAQMQNRDNSGGLQGAGSASEDDDDEDGDAGNRSAAATDAESSTAGGQRDAKRQKRTK